MRWAMWTCVLAAVGAAGSVDAQPLTAAPSLNPAVDEIIVTARRRQEVLKDVPVAVSALGAERLEATGAADLTALQQQTPNATVQTARGSNSTLVTFIRGVGQQEPLWGYDPGVGLYIGDVYIARPQGAVLDIFDVERIEVLRGPQGTLYGRNTIGGAIKYVTRPLDLARPTAMVRGQVGAHDERNLFAKGSVPLGPNLAVGAAIATYNHAGYGTNLTTGADQYDKDAKAFRASAEWSPTADVAVRLAYDRVDDDSNPRHGHREIAGSTPASLPLPGVYDTRAGLGDLNRVETEGVSLTGTWRLNATLTAKSVTARRTSDTDTLIDIDGTPTPTLDAPAVYSNDLFSQEFQLLHQGERLRGVAGVYLLNGYAAGAYDTITAALNQVTLSAGKVSTTSLAVFADGSYDLTDRLTLSAGGRWTRDNKNGDAFRGFYAGATLSPRLGGTPRPVTVVRTRFSAEKSAENFSPRISLSYDLTDALTGYVSYSEGFKSGGWDVRGDATLAPQTVDGYEPETVAAYELGLKGALFDRRLSFASAAFYSDYSNQQITTQQVAQPPAVGIVSVVDNAGASTIYGAEFEAAAALGGHLSANASLGYLHAQFDEFITRISGAPVDIASTRAFQNAPRWSGFASLTWRGDLLGGQLKVTHSLSYRSAFHLFDVADPILDQRAYTLVDLNLSWAAPGDRYTLGLAGRNLGGETYRIGGYSYNAATYNNTVIAYYGPPRTWAVWLQARF